MGRRDDIDDRANGMQDWIAVGEHMAGWAVYVSTVTASEMMLSVRCEALGNAVA